jgi:uncharacterized membrane protein YheB (UPF0754 family)
MRDQIWLFVTVPLVTALIGYVTNWAAVWMMFHPTEPKGVGPLRWQGIVHRMSDNLAAEISRTTSHVLGPHDIVERLDLATLIERLRTTRRDEIEEIVERAFDQVAPGAWSSAAPEAKEQLEALLLAQVGSQMGDAIETLGPRLHDILDLEQLIVDELTGENSQRLARVSQEIGGKELRFVELYGGIFGFFVGLVQAGLFSIFGIWWTMPIVGGIVGLGTNWLAIQMIFRPLEPTRFLGLATYQGMFPKRQKEIARDYGAITEREIFTPQKLVAALVDGPGFELLLDELRAPVRDQIEQYRPLLAGVAGGASISDDQVAALVGSVERDALAALPLVRPEIEAHLDGSLQLGDLIEHRLGELDKAKFERMLRGIFEEREWILIVVGGALGAGMGTIQGLVVRVLDL